MYNIVNILHIFITIFVIVIVNYSSVCHFYYNLWKPITN